MELLFWTRAQGSRQANAWTLVGHAPGARQQGWFLGWRPRAPRWSRVVCHELGILTLDHHGWAQRVSALQHALHPHLARPLELMLDPVWTSPELGPAAQSPWLYESTCVSCAEITLDTKITDLTMPLPPGKVLSWARQACLGLEHALHEGVVHGALGPHALRLGPCGVLRVDGWADPMSQDLLDHNLHLFLPHPHDELRQTFPLDASSLIFWVGVVLYEWLTGSHPFLRAGVRPWAAPREPFLTPWLLHTSPRHLPPPPSRETPGLPRAVDELVLACLHKDPRLRPSSLRELIRALERLGASPPEALELDLADALAWSRQQVYERRCDRVADLLQARPDLLQEPVLTDYLWQHLGADSLSRLATEDERLEDVLLLSALPQTPTHLRPLAQDLTRPWPLAFEALATLMLGPQHD